METVFVVRRIVMSGDIPRNEVRSATHTVSGAGLFRLFEKLHQDPNVISIEHEKEGANFRVTVYYAVMDLEVQFAAVSAFIELAVDEANRVART